MKIPFIFAALLLVSVNAAADWTKLTTHPGQVEYADFSTVRMDGALKQIWKLQDFETEKCIGAACYRSIKSLHQYDCKHETSRIKYVVFYAEAMGQGRDLKTLNERELGSDGEFAPVVPDTQGYYEFQGICGTEQKKK
ncbi:hypothetical protein GTP58_26500 [Duganella sp. CY15W]|uniref:surface-adhesin E family protein n=1 Tax=Duganella sp. CY15W TaxID=2692172 RepID=UPI001367BBDC|nr:surface-adhesin E family protein [Duganella sp. CY15W]MYM31886.1 hypothetical protein [Duganella sp. CY15W]